MLVVPAMDDGESNQQHRVKNYKKSGMNRVFRASENLRQPRNDGRIALFPIYRKKGR